MKLLILLFICFNCYAQTTYSDGCTTYYKDRCYANGGNMVKRSRSNVMKFLKSKGLKAIPKSFEVDHIIP